MIRFLRNVFMLFFIVVALGGGGWLYWQNQMRLEKEKLALALQQKDFVFLAEHFKNLKLKEDSSSESYLEKCFYKATALQNLKQTFEAKPFWELLAKNTLNRDHCAQAMYSLGLQALQSNNTQEALSWFEGKILSDLQCSLYGSAMLEIARIYGQSKEGKHWDKAVAILRAALKKIQNPAAIQEIKTLCGELNEKRLYSRTVLPNFINHEVSSGESLALIAQKYNSTVDLIMKTNALKSSRLRPHNHLKIFTGTFSTQISKTENTLTLLENDEFFKEYLVGTGKDNTTPVGDFEITSKQANPIWYRPDGSIIPFGNKENLLGTRWMSINYPGYGIHGTWDSESLGKQSSAGCVRLRNADVEELFTILPLHTKVKIVE